jgi:hypothetical protein
VQCFVVLISEGFFEFFCDFCAGYGPPQQQGYYQQGPMVMGPPQQQGYYGQQIQQQGCIDIWYFLFEF